MNFPRLIVLFILALCVANAHAKPAKIVLIAGPVTGHPKDAHEYEKNVILLRHLIEASPDLKDKAIVETHFNGWPADEKTLDDADTILITSDGGDHRLEDHPFYIGNRMETLARQMKRGCGLIQFHWSTFNPVKSHDQITQWLGGYFDYETGTGTANKWRSAITTRADWLVEPYATHPITRGVKPFKLKEEFYHHLRFNDDDKRLVPIVTIGKGDRQEWTVGWAVERSDGGRGFGFTGGHFFENWWNDDFRTLMLGAIAWTAKLEVPATGIRSTMPRRWRTLIVTGHNHPAHDWSATTTALLAVIELDPFAMVDVTENPEYLAGDKLKDYDLLLLNYCNWDRGGLSEKAKANFTRFIEEGGGLAVVHFANGAFNPTLPAKDSDWPAFRTMVRRVWMHGEGRSGHDAFGPFKVNITAPKHPVTTGLADFETTDELYFKQEGDAAIEPLATAKSKVTGKDEPMAWAYDHGKGRVFQTVLGHDGAAIRKAGALIRRGGAWAAKRETISFDPPAAITENHLFRGGAQWKPQPKPSPEGRGPASAPSTLSAKTRAAVGVASLDKSFGKALTGGLVVDGKDDFRAPPITVECWAKVVDRSGFNILIASEPKASPTHWEVYTYAGSGVLSAYLPGTKEGEIRSDVDICDGRWHHVAFIYEPSRVRLYIDAKLAKDQAITRGDGKALGGGLAFGRLVEGTIGLDGAVEDVHVRRGVHEVSAMPQSPAKADKDTIGLWDFELVAADEGSAKPQPATTGVLPPTKVDMKDKDVNPSLQKESDWVDDRWSKTDLGRFFSCTMRTPVGDVTRAIAIRVGDKGQGAVCFDATDCVMRAGWTGGFLKLDPARYGLIRWPAIDGTVQFNSPKGPPEGVRRKYLRLWHHGDRVIVQYSIDKGGVVIESPWIEQHDGVTAFTRSFEFQLPQNEFTLDLCDAGSRVAIVGDAGFTLKRDDQRVSIVIPKSKKNPRIRAFIAPMSVDEKKFDALVKASTFKVEDPFDDDVLAEPWPREITTKGVVAADSGPYVVDTITVPFENPYHALFFISGVDFIDANTAAVCTVHGDVWIVSGIDGKFDKLTWRRFATGLYQPLGLKVIEDEVYVLGRDRITKVTTAEGKRGATYYESIAELPTTSPGGHDYAACLEADAAGNLYWIDPRGIHRFIKPEQSWGQWRHETLATGFRNPIALSVGPGGEVTASPQEGEWTPSSAIYLMNKGEKGRYFGYGGPRVSAERPLGYDLPLCWVPHHVDNSTGGQVWVTSDKWGPVKGQLLNLSFGMCTAQLVLRDEVDGVAQGAVVPLKFRCSSGIMRGRFSPFDGQLYVTGMRGWQTNAVHDGCLQRIRFTGKKVLTPVGWKVGKGELSLTFAAPLDRESAEDVQGYAVEQWNYLYSRSYGSKEYSVNNPGIEGHDAVTVKGARLSADGKTVTLVVPEVKPVMQIKVKYDLETQGAEAARGEVFGTIHKVPQR
jgi:type 1 glutamine amidotransferase